MTTEPLREELIAEYLKAERDLQNSHRQASFTNNPVTYKIASAESMRLSTLAAQCFAVLTDEEREEAAKRWSQA